MGIDYDQYDEEVHGLVEETYGDGYTDGMYDGGLGMTLVWVVLLGLWEVARLNGM